MRYQCGRQGRASDETIPNPGRQTLVTNARVKDIGGLVMKPYQTLGGNP